ncbi:MAG: DNA gyrase inhibitor YacG [Devosia sp.]
MGTQAFSPKPCPICSKPSSQDARPFCSKRCADIDLHRWLGGHYAIPVPDDDTEGTDEAEADLEGPHTPAR